MIDDTKCIFCGEIVPEGRLVCPICESKVQEGEYLLEKKQVTRKKHPIKNFLRRIFK